MELVFISKSKGALARVQVHLASICVVAVLASAVCGGAAYWGYVEGSKAVETAMLTDPAYASSVWQSEIVVQRKIVDDIRLDVQSDLDTLAVRAGRLQAHVTRLDALAERLVDVANLDPAEFGLADAPPIGGPAPADFVPPQWASLLANLESLSGDLSVREDRLEGLESLLFSRQLRDNMHPDGRPVEDAWISSGFGYRTHPVTGAKEFHSGIDFAGKQGLDVKAVGAGIITWSGRRWGYGNMVEINHGNGYVTRYAHNKKNLVGIGERIDKDQKIALLGSTGRSTGPHVHFEVLRNGKVVDPWKFIRHVASQ